jgi:flavin reductase (DIM6/NTAB) family NADH-FMN oxidoreductase RutF
MIEPAKRSFDFEALPFDACYRLMTATIVPRPIAWITTISSDGVVNAAPYSFFNMMGSAPPVVAIGAMARAGQPKDTAANIRDTGGFVVNLVPERLKNQMNITCVDAPADIDELQLAGLTSAPSTRIAAPRIAEAPVAFECQRLQMVETGPSQFVIIGRVIMAHIAEEWIEGDDRPRVDTPGLGLIGRMHGSDMYARTSDLFSMPRQTWPLPGKD